MKNLNDFLEKELEEKLGQEVFDRGYVYLNDSFDINGIRIHSKEETIHIREFLVPFIRQLTQKLVAEIINELESNPNEDGSQSPNIQHFIERKQMQLRKKFWK